MPQGRALSGRLDHPACAFALTLLVYTLFVAHQLSLVHFDASRFVVAGDFFCDTAKTPPSLHVLPDSAGYDGQFYYRLALNPWSDQREEYGIRLDAPTTRSSRIL